MRVKRKEKLYILKYVYLGTGTRYMSLICVIGCSPLNTPKKDAGKRPNPETPVSQRKRKKVNYKESEDEEEDDEDDSDEVYCGPTEAEIEEAFSESPCNKFRLLNAHESEKHDICINRSGAQEKEES